MNALKRILAAVLLLALVLAAVSCKKDKTDETTAPATTAPADADFDLV